MPPKTKASKRLITSPRSARARCATLLVSLLVSLRGVFGDAHVALTASSSRSDEESATLGLDEREASLAQGRRSFDSTVRPRLEALLALNANEIGERECSSSSAKDPVRGRLD